MQTSVKWEIRQSPVGDHLRRFYCISKYPVVTESMKKKNNYTTHTSEKAKTEFDELKYFENKTNYYFFKTAGNEIIRQIPRNIIIVIYKQYFDVM